MSPQDFFLEIILDLKTIKDDKKEICVKIPKRLQQAKLVVRKTEYSLGDKM